MHPEPGRAARAARWCAAVATGLVVSCLIFGPSLGSMGLIGAQAAHTGRDRDLVHADLERDKILTATQALEYGIVDQVLSSRKSRPSPRSA